MRRILDSMFSCVTKKKKSKQVVIRKIKHYGIARGRSVGEGLSLSFEGIRNLKERDVEVYITLKSTNRLLYCFIGKTFIGNS